MGWIDSGGVGGHVQEGHYGDHHGTLAGAYLRYNQNDFQETQTVLTIGT